MSEEISKLVEDATNRGRFEGQVLQSLTDIKVTLEKMEKKHINYDEEFGKKADKQDVEDLKRRVWTMSGGAAVLGTLLSKLF